MNGQAKAIIAALGATSVLLAIALVVAVSDENDGDMPHMTASAGYGGMMQAMGNMDSDTMLARMREVLGADGFQRMLDHISEHRNGKGMPGGSGMDGMMHQMLDGMMQQMPADRQNIMPMSPH